MKIVIATPFYPPESGVLGMYAQGLEGAFERAGHSVTVVRFSMFAHYPSLLRHILFAVRLGVAARGADFIMALDTFSVGVPAAFVSKLLGVPLILRIGGDFVWEAYAERTKQPIRFSDVYHERANFSTKERVIMAGVRMVLHQARALFFNTRFQIDAWQPIYGFDRAKAHVLENVIPARGGDIQPPRGCVFVAAGRTIALKNFDLLENAFKRAKEKYPDIELDRRSLPPDEHRARLKETYAVIIPSISEISSNTAVDAVIAGKPFIMTDDTGTKERLGECGIFIDTRSEEAVAAAILRLLDEKEYRAFAETIRAFSFSHSFDDIAKEIVAAV